ncbi:MAG: EamA family transporter RarD [Proteobacteria bacterium]|nr:EamA family transporter RarD [Pseudomonadota bacterium]MBU1389046.1 EamA family transporter RarD [Pseudomonadota bacterium]MBU1543598.1 EamA family transporter RarD [Pseudomonadota bacterium]MBU2481949.1 EamA family transporter RarD [Pseudomonadota bacterium]
MEKPVGVLFGIAAFVAWGFLPAYWKQMLVVSPVEILCHRIVWSCVFLSGIITLQRRWPEVRGIIKNPLVVKRLCLSTMLIGFNWFVYIWAVNSARVVETSLGYYMTPMINVVLGFLFLGEKFNRLQGVAILFALTGVMYSLIAYGSLPAFALALSLSFALYGFARKKISAAPLPGLLVETMILFIPAFAYIVFKVSCNDSYFLKQSGLTFWMLGSGLATSLPLLWFAAAAKRLNLSTIGILQYLAPSIAFGLGVFVYKEPFNFHTLITFACIWTGVVFYTRGAYTKMSVIGRTKVM